MKEMAQGVATTYRCQMEYEVLSDCPSVVTDDAVTALVEDTIKSMLPQAQVIHYGTGMGTEDFAQITDKVPGSYYIIGAGPEDPAKRLGQHNPKIIFNEDVLSDGAAIYAQVAMNWLEKNS